MTAAGPPLPAGVTTVRESRVEAAGIPLYAAGRWSEAFDWLIHGATGAGADADLGLFGTSSAGAVHGRWRSLQRALGAPTAVNSAQVHGADILEHRESVPGLVITHGFDGHVTAVPGVLLTVSVADCVPIALVDENRRRVALLHGGWRGTAAGIIEAGLDALGSEPGAVHAHLGPAICGSCYEVGPEVHAALRLPVPDGNVAVNLRGVQARQLLDEGVPAAQLTVSEHCTRCGDGFFSHRGGSGGRQIGVLGIR